MNKKTKLLKSTAVALACTVGLTVFAAFAGCNKSADGGEWKVASADGTVELTAKLSGGELKYSVEKSGKSVIRDSSTGLDADLLYGLNGKLFSPTVTTEAKDISYSVITGKKSQVNTHYNQLKLTFEDNEVIYDVVFRAYDDGFAFRYGINSKGGSDELVIIGEEYTEFALPEQSTAYLMTTPDYKERFCYEESYVQRRSDKINGVIASMPMLYKTRDDVWALITESAVIDSGYRGSFLEGDGESTFHVKPAYTQTPTVVASAPFVSPWRMGIVGDLGTIVESTLVEDVYDEVGYYKPDNYDSLTAEEQAAYSYDWVEPSKVAWTWLKLGSGTQKEWDTNEEYIKAAADRGWNWFLIDAGWVPATEAELKSFNDMMAYAKGLGVHMMCWAHSYNDLGTEAKMRENFAKWREYGFEGIKIDFFDGLYNTTDISQFGESQYTEEFYSTLYSVAAEYKLILNIHGSCKPTGERRVYPHVISREGVRGNEYKADVFASDCVSIPFIRGAVGPVDYTPSLKPFDDNTTVASQMAMHIMYETGTITMGDSPKWYRSYAEAGEFLDGLPVVYDDIKYISGSPLSSCVIARRKGSEWYIGGMTVAAGQMSVDLGKILDKNKQYEVVIFSDGADYLAVQRQVKTVYGNDVLKINAIRNGGFAVSIKEKI